MRAMDSSYDRATSEHRSEDPGAVAYALVSDHNGPCSVIGRYGSLADAIEAAREMDTDAAPSDLEDDLGVDATDGRTGTDAVDWLIEQATQRGWRVVASAPAGEYWTVLAE